jgi:hypothetical protein
MFIKKKAGGRLDRISLTETAITRSVTAITPSVLKLIRLEPKCRGPYDRISLTGYFPGAFRDERISSAPSSSANPVRARKRRKLPS